MNMKMWKCGNMKLWKYENGRIPRLVSRSLAALGICIFAYFHNSHICILRRSSRAGARFLRLGRARSRRTARRMAVEIKLKGEGEIGMWKCENVKVRTTV